MIFKKVLQPNRWILLCMLPMSFAALIFIFEIQNTKSTLAYLAYCMSVFYLVLGILRLYLIYSYRHRSPELESRCYRRTAWMLFLLNIPMGGMIVLMVRTNSGFSYPGYIIYLSAFYTFYTMVISVLNLVKFRKLGSPILSAAKVLNFIAAMMSILGLQTAMISRFSENGEAYRKMMNTITGGFVYGIVIVIAITMLLHSKKSQKKVESIE